MADQAQAEKKFRSVSTTQDSIQSVSLWVIHHKTQHEKLVDIWFNVLKKSKIEHRLTLFYVCNDIVQTCRRKHAVVYKDAFKEVLKDATLLVRDGSVKSSVKRIFKIWKERIIYDGEFIDELVDIIDHTKVQPTISSKLVADFQPLTLMEKVITLNRYESELEHRRRHLVNLRLDASSLEAIRQLKDKEHGQDFCREFESACAKMDDYVRAVEKELADKNELIELLEQSEFYYDAQYGEAKIVANAYKTFGQKVSTLRKHLNEKISSLPATLSPAHSPPPALEEHAPSSPDVTPPRVEEITSPRRDQDHAQPGFPPAPAQHGFNDHGATPPAYYASALGAHPSPAPPPPAPYAPEPPTPPTPKPPAPHEVPAYRASPRHTPVEIPAFLQQSGGAGPRDGQGAGPVGSRDGKDQLEAVDMDVDSDGEPEPGVNGHAEEALSPDFAPKASPIVDNHSGAPAVIPGLAQGASKSFFGKEDLLASIRDGVSREVSPGANPEAGGSTPVMDEGDTTETRVSGGERERKHEHRRHSDERRRDDRYYDRRYDDSRERRHERGSRSDERRRDSRESDRHDDEERNKKHIPVTKTNPIDFLTSLINAKPSAAVTSTSGTFLANLGASLNSANKDTPSETSEGSWANWKASESVAAGSTVNTGASLLPPPPMFGAPPRPPMPPALSPPGTNAAPSYNTNAPPFSAPLPPGFPPFAGPSNAGTPQPNTVGGMNSSQPMPFGAPPTPPSVPSGSQPPAFPHPPPFRPQLDPITSSVSQSGPYGSNQPGVNSFRPTLSAPPNSTYQPPHADLNTSPQNAAYPPPPRGPGGDYGAGRFPTSGTPPTPPAFPAPPNSYQGPRFPNTAAPNQPFSANRFASTPPANMSARGSGGAPGNRPGGPDGYSSQHNAPWNASPQRHRFSQPQNKTNLTTIQTVDTYGDASDRPGGPRFPPATSSSGHVVRGALGSPPPRFSHDGYNHQHGPARTGESGEGQMEFIDKLRRKSSSLGSESGASNPSSLDRQNSSNLRTLTGDSSETPSWSDEPTQTSSSSSNTFGISSFISSMRKQSDSEPAPSTHEPLPPPPRAPGTWDDSARYPGPPRNPHYGGNTAPPRPRGEFRSEFNSPRQFRPPQGGGPRASGAGPQRFQRFPGQRSPHRPRFENFGPTW